MYIFECNYSDYTGQYLLINWQQIIAEMRLVVIYSYVYIFSADLIDF